MERTENKEAINNAAGWKGGEPRWKRINARYKNSQFCVVCFLAAVQRRVKMCYLMSQHPVELLFRDGQPLPVCTVHHQDDELRSRRQKSDWVISFQTAFTAMK